MNIPAGSMLWWNGKCCGIVVPPTTGLPSALSPPKLQLIDHKIVVPSTVKEIILPQKMSYEHFAESFGHTVDAIAKQWGIPGGLIGQGCVNVSPNSQAWWMPPPSVEDLLDRTRAAVAFGTLDRKLDAIALMTSTKSDRFDYAPYQRHRSSWLNCF